MASRVGVLSRLVSRVIHSPRPSIFRPLPSSEEVKQCPGKMGALYPDPNATISRGLHSSVPICKSLPGKTGIKGDFRYYPNHYVFGLAIVPNTSTQPARDITTELGYVVPHSDPSVEPYVRVPVLVPPDHPGVTRIVKQPRLKEFKGEAPDGGASDVVRGRFEYDDSEMESEEGLWEMYKRWQLHFFGENDDKEKRNSRRFKKFKKFKKSAQIVYDVNKKRGENGSYQFDSFAALYTPPELERVRLGQPIRGRRRGSQMIDD